MGHVEEAAFRTKTAMDTVGQKALHFAFLPIQHLLILFVSMGSFPGLASWSPSNSLSPCSKKGEGEDRFSRLTKFGFPGKAIFASMRNR